MTRAPFLSTAAPAALLGGADAEAVDRRLAGERVGLAFDAVAAERPEGLIAIELAARLLVRTWPRLTIIDLSGRNHELVRRLVALAHGINEGAHLSEDPSDVTLTLVVGDTPFVGGGPVVYVGSRGWIARFSPDGPVGSGTTSNPFGAAAAACLGVANLFRTAFADAFSGSFLRGVDGATSLSTFDYSRGLGAADPPMPAVDLSGTYLVGTGSLGSATAWALARVPDIHGTVSLIDSEVVEPAHIQRNVLATRADIGAPKVNLAAGELLRADLDVRPHAQTWSEYLTTQGNWNLPRVAVAGGTADDRVSVQAALPRVVLNAWTQVDDIGVSRHADFLRAPCLACLYGPRDPARGSSWGGDAFGIAQAGPEIEALVLDRAPADRHAPARIAASTHTEVEELLSAGGATLRALNRRGSPAARGSTETQRAHGAMAFQSALAGVLLAAEIVVDAALPRRPLPSTTRVDLRRPLAEHLLVPAPRDPYGRCFCGDADYREVYARKFLT